MSRIAKMALLALLLVPAAGAGAAELVEDETVCGQDLITWRGALSLAPGEQPRSLCLRLTLGTPVSGFLDLPSTPGLRVVEGVVQADGTLRFKWDGPAGAGPLGLRFTAAGDSLRFTWCVAAGLAGGQGPELGPYVCEDTPARDATWSCVKGSYSAHCPRN